MSQANPLAILPFTGERFTPECVREIAYEHWHRYAFVLSHVAGKKVLDAACGEGFGASLLSDKAGSVLAVDIDAASIEHANARYGRKENLGFRQADVTQLDELPDGSFDVIVSFETLEHVMDHDRMLAGFKRLLKPDGLLLISTPDKKNYSDATGVVNPHHVRELYFDEFAALLDRHFPLKKIYTQKLLFQSSLSALDGEGSPETLVHTSEGIVQGMAYPPMYYVAVCANSAGSLAGFPGLSIYGDAEESVYAHYNHEVRYGIWATRRIAELEQQLIDKAASDE
ncbi:MAG: class I SAM-dependent methyltransferase [Arenimonas sp.]